MGTLLYTGHKKLSPTDVTTNWQELIFGSQYFYDILHTVRENKTGVNVGYVYFFHILHYILFHLQLKFIFPYKYFIRF